MSVYILLQGIPTVVQDGYEAEKSASGMYYQKPRIMNSLNIELQLTTKDELSRDLPDDSLKLKIMESIMSDLGINSDFLRKDYPELFI